MVLKWNLCTVELPHFEIIPLLPQPKVVTDTDETELARQLERLEKENAEVDGDDDAEEMEAKAED